MLDNTVRKVKQEKTDSEKLCCLILGLPVALSSRGPYSNSAGVFQTIKLEVCLLTANKFPSSS